VDTLQDHQTIKETAVKFIKPIISFAMSKFVPALVLTFVACSMTFAQDVRTNYMPGTDFSTYHTYTWVDEVQGIPAVGGHPDQILDAQVKQAIDLQMVAKGFTKVEDGSKGDLLLGYQLAIDQEKQTNGFGDNLGSWGPWAAWGPWGGWARGGVASVHFRPVLQPLTSGLSWLACMTLLQKSSFG